MLFAYGLYVVQRSPLDAQANTLMLLSAKLYGFNIMQSSHHAQANIEGWQFQIAKLVKCCA